MMIYDCGRLRGVSCIYWRNQMRFKLIFITAFIIAIISGCSGVSQSPVSPSDTTSNAISSGMSVDKHLWGYWNVAIDTVSGGVELIPLRGAEFTANVVNFLQPPAGSIANLQVQITDLTNFPGEGRLTVDVTLKHPFPGLDEYTGFDVYGVFVHTGGMVFMHGNEAITITDGDTSAILENADGYTCWISPVLFHEDGSILTFTTGKLGNPGFPGQDGAMANGYRYFADGLDPDEDVGIFFNFEDGASDRGMFTPGSANTRVYELRFPMPSGEPVIEFQYAVVANWEPPQLDLSGEPDVLDVPGDFPTSANAKEAVFMRITDESTTYYVDETNFGGDIILDLEIYDWDGLEGIGNIYVSSPGPIVPGGSAMFDPSGLDWDTSGVNSSVTTVEIIGAEPDSTENQEVFIAVESASPTSYEQGFGTPAPDLPLANYWRHTVNVSDENVTPEISALGEASIEPYFDGFGPEGTSDDPIPTEWWLTLDASGSTGPIDQYLWEMSGDDLFDDAEGMIVSAGFPDTGTHGIKLKVTDGFGGEEIYELPGSYEVVEGTYVWSAYSGGTPDGTRELPWMSIPHALTVEGTNGYILVRGDDNAGGQCVYTDNLLITSVNADTRIQGYYGDYDTDEPPMQTGYVRVEGQNITFDGFEVTGPANSYYTPFGHYSKLGISNADGAVFRHLYIHDINGNCKAILGWAGGDLTCENILEYDLGCMFQKNQIHYGDPYLELINCTFDKLEMTSYGWGIYCSGGSLQTRNCIWTDIGSGSFSYYLRSATSGLHIDFNCTYDTPASPNGGTYYDGPFTMGSGNVQVDPQYVNTHTDHHLQAGSPLIDTGDPTITDHDGSASDYGCYGGPYGDWDFEN